MDKYNDNFDNVMIGEAFSHFAETKLNDILDSLGRTKLDVTFNVSINHVGENIMIEGVAFGLSSRALEEVLSYSVDWDLKGQALTGLHFNALFEQEFFDEIIVEKNKDYADDVDDIENSEFVEDESDEDDDNEE